MDQTYTTMMSGLPTALLIWLAMIGVIALAFGVLAAVAGQARRRPGAEPAVGADVPATGYVPRNEATLRALAAAKRVTDEPPATSPPPPAKLALLEADAPRESDEQRFADELATAATRAGVTADRKHTEWEYAQRAVESAWNAYQEADKAAGRAIRAAAFPTPQTPLTPAEFADRERYLHRVAQAAHARGEISTDQLIDALSHRNGFDPRLHPFEQDALLRKLARDRRLRVYQTAADMERTAWRDADLAKAAKSSLDREAATAARNVTQRPEPTGERRHVRASAVSPSSTVLSLR